MEANAKQEDSQKIGYPDPILIFCINESLERHGNGFISKGNFDYFCQTFKDFPEGSPVKIIPDSKEDKITYVASYFLFHLIAGHPFTDGNKRTAFISVTILLTKNKMLTNYSEEKISNYLEKINRLIENGENPQQAIKKFEGDIKDSPEYELIKLLFDIAGGGDRRYESPLEVYPKMKSFIIKLQEEQQLPAEKAGFIIKTLERVEQYLHSLLDNLNSKK